MNISTTLRCGHPSTAENLYVSPAGRQQCRVCKAAAMRRYCENNRQKTRDHAREYRTQNPGKARLAITRSKAAKPELYRDARQRLYAADPSKQRERSNRYYESHPEKRREHLTNRRARKYGLFVEYVKRSVVFNRDAGLCGLCDQPVDPTNWHLDHIIPLSRGGEHSYRNTQVTHPACNLRKGTRLPEELRCA